MILTTYKETYKGLDKVYRFTEEQQYLLSVWAQCLLDRNWANTMYFTTPDYPDADEVRKMIKRSKPFFQEELGINVASLKPTVKNIIVASYIEGYYEGYSMGGYRMMEKTKANNIIVPC